MVCSVENRTDFERKRTRQADLSVKCKNSVRVRENGAIWEWQPLSDSILFIYKWLAPTMESSWFVRTIIRTLINNRRTTRRIRCRRLSSLVTNRCLPIIMDLPYSAIGICFLDQPRGALCTDASMYTVANSSLQRWAFFSFFFLFLFSSSLSSALRVNTFDKRAFLTLF